MALLRRTLRKINWIVRMSRLEIGCHLCEISLRVKSGTVFGVNTINKVIKFIKTMPSHIIISVLELEHLQLLLYSDTSFINYFLDGGIAKEGI